MPTYAVESIEDVTIAPGSRIQGMDLMSPFVWPEAGGYRMLVRAVPAPLGPHDPTGLIAAASSSDGLNFTVAADLAIVPGTDPADADAGGCEDPTVLIDQLGGYLVFYTGVDAARQQGAMLVAEGPRLDALVKRKVLLKAPPGEGNIKEATIVQTPAGDWRLFYEYAADNASRIGVAATAVLGGLWEAQEDPFTVRADSWDNWHLSTGPICQLPGADPVMFYNGATADARWRIGWVSFSPDYARVTGRGLMPVLVPPPPEQRSATDIGFAASSIVEDGMVSLYFSLEDRILRRARIKYYA